jgi:hypothetical protein
MATLSKTDEIFMEAERRYEEANLKLDNDELTPQQALDSGAATDQWLLAELAKVDAPLAEQVKQDLIKQAIVYARLFQ